MTTRFWFSINPWQAKCVLADCTWRARNKNVMCMNVHRVINKLTLATLRFHLAAVYSILLLRQIRKLNVIKHTWQEKKRIISLCVCVCVFVVHSVLLALTSVRSGNLCASDSVCDTKSRHRHPFEQMHSFKSWFLFRWEKRFWFRLFRAGMRSELVGKCGRGFCVVV